jgi:GNAT superfamily N-acetyltransferase
MFYGGTDIMKVKTTFLQMFARPQRIVPPPRDGLAVVHARNPPVAYYRFLYDTVGREYDWTSRKKLSDTELAALLRDPRIEVHVLMLDGVPAGFAELDRRLEGEIELVQFGLLPHYIGLGLGRYFLNWTIDKAWSYGPRRFWLHTCTKDHPGALPNYLKAGFVVYKEEVKDQS